MNGLLNAALGYAGSPRSGQAPAPKSSGTGDAGEHLAHAIAAHKRGDHKAAKKHALKAVNMLHRMTGTPQSPPPDPAAPPAVAPGA